MLKCAAPLHFAAAAAAATAAAAADLASAVAAAPESFVAPTPPGADSGAVGDEELASLLKARSDAKARRDFATADSIRSDLEQRGIKLVDARTPGMVGTWVEEKTGRR